MNILLVEDELALSNAIKRILEQQSYRVDAVYDADELIRRCREYCAAQAFAERCDDNGLQAVQKRGSRALLAFVYQRLISGEPVSPELIRRLAETPAEVAAAMFLATV